jgi:hypothetical protein
MRENPARARNKYVFLGVQTIENSAYGHTDGCQLRAGMDRETLTAVTDVHLEIFIRLRLAPKLCVEVSNEAD